MSNNIDVLKGIRNSAYKRIRNKTNKHNIVDCFNGKYTFIRKFDEYRFNKEINNSNAVHMVLEKEYDLTNILQKDIKNPIVQGSNMTFGFIGETGTGKSENAKKIALLSKTINKKHMNRETNGRYGFHLCWDKNDFEDVLKILKKGDIILKDEMPIHMGKGRLTQQWSIDNILNTVRMMQNTFIFVDPRKINMPCNIYLESAGMDKKARKNRVMLLDIDKNNKKQYYGHAYIKLHDDVELRTWYENEKQKFINRNLKIGGKFKVKNVIDVEFKEIDEELVKKLIFLEETYIPPYKPEEKERNIMIWRLHQLEFKDKDICDVSGMQKATIRFIYNKLNDFFKNYI